MTFLFWCILLTYARTVATRQDSQLIRGILVETKGVLTVAPFGQEFVPFDDTSSLSFAPPTKGTSYQDAGFYHWLYWHLNQEVMVFVCVQDSFTPHQTVVVGFPQEGFEMQPRSLEFFLDEGYN